MKPSAQPSEVEDHRPGGTSLADWAAERAAFRALMDRKPEVSLEMGRPTIHRPDSLVMGRPTIERVPGPHVELTMGQPTVERTPGSNIELVMGQPTIDRGPQVSLEAGQPSLFRNGQQPGQIAAEDGLFSLPPSRK